MSESLDGVTFKIRRRLRLRSALGFALLSIISGFFGHCLGEGPLRERPALVRGVLVLVAAILGLAAVFWLVRPFLDRPVLITVLPKGLRVLRDHGYASCDWSQIVDVEVGTAADYETVIQVHAGFGHLVNLPLDCTRDPKFLALVQLYGGSANPLTAFLRERQG